MKRILFTCICIILFLPSFSQTKQQLSKKETKEIVERVKDLVAENDYESAISVYQLNKELISVKNITRSDRDWWVNMGVEFDKKVKQYDNSEAQVNAAEKLFSNQEYWKCNEMLKGLKLDRSCAREETLKQYDSVLGKIESVKSILDDVNSKLLVVIDLYNTKNVEQMYLVFFDGIKKEVEKSGGSILGYVSQEYLPKVKAIISEYEAGFVQYYECCLSQIAKANKRISKMPSISEIGHKKAYDNLVYFKSLESYMKRVAKDYPSESYPYFSLQKQKILDYASKSIPLLNKRYKETDPVNVVFKGGKMSLDQIKDDCSPMDQKLRSILALDVMSYYNKRFSTVLQASVFKESSEYKELYSDLQKKRGQVQNTVYYSIMNVNTGPYDLDEGCFYLRIGSNKGTQSLFPGMSATVHHSNQVDGVVHESLPVFPFTNRLIAAAYRNGSMYYDYYVKVPVPKSVAINMEKIDCDLVICFLPAGVKTYRCMGADFDGRGTYDIFYADKEYPFSRKCRMMLFSRDGRLMVDKIL